MDYFLFNFSGVQFHYTMSLLNLGKKFNRRKKARQHHLVILSGGVEFLGKAKNQKTCFQPIFFMLL